MLVVEVVSDHLGTRSVRDSQSTMVGQPEHDGGCVARVYTNGTTCSCTFLWAKGLPTEEVHCETASHVW